MFAPMLAVVIGLATQTHERPLVIRVDGTVVAAESRRRTATVPLVDVAPIARVLGWRVSKDRDDVVLRNDSRTLALSIGSRTVREDDDERPPLAEPLRERAGSLWLPSADIATLFNVAVDVTQTSIAIARPKSISTHFLSSDVPLPIPSTAPAQRRVRATPAPVANGRRALGRIAFAFERRGALNAYRLDARATSAYVSGTAFASGIGTLGAPGATVVLGTPERNAEIGGIGDPLGGLVYAPKIAEGAAFHRHDGGLGAFLLHHASDGRTIAGIARETAGDSTQHFAIVTKDGRYDGTVFVARRRSTDAYGEGTSEIVASDRGVGVGYAYRMRGQTFGEVRVSAATARVPGTDSNAPLRLAIGRQFSGTTTVVAGLGGGIRGPLAPFAGVTTRLGETLATLSSSGTTEAASLSYARDDLTISSYATFGARSSSAIVLHYALARAALEVRDDRANGTDVASFEVRTASPGIAVIAGFGAQSGYVGPIAGIAIPLGGGLTLQATARPSGDHTLGIHAALEAEIRSSVRKHLSHAHAIVTLDGRDDDRPYVLVVDGTQARRFTGSTIALDLEPGEHTISAQSLDGLAGTVDRDVTVAARETTHASLTSRPLRTVVGRIVLPAISATPPNYPLAGIVVRAEPGGSEVETDARGQFAFVRASFAEETTFTIRSSTLPSSLRAGLSRRTESGEIVFELQPAIEVERRVFRDKTHE